MLYDTHYRMAALAAIETSLHFGAKSYDAVCACKERVVLAHTDIPAGDDAGAALAYDNHAGLSLSAVSDLHAQKLRIGVRQVFSCSATLFCCHMLCILCPMNIQESWLKIKSAHRLRQFLEDAAIPLIVILVGAGSFGLGRISALEAQKQPIAISQTAASIIPAGGQVVASKSGAKYHFPWCSGAAAISEKNKIVFENAEKARVAGYLPAGNCKGLE